MTPATDFAQTAQQREGATTIFERGAPGRRASHLPELDVPRQPLDDLIPARLRRVAPPKLPEVSEPEIVRHYVRLSKRNFDLDSGFYPLGSCTMKYNPKLHERAAALPGHARLHPLQRPARARVRWSSCGTCSTRWPRWRDRRMSRCSRVRARTGSWPACC